jgi:hypothetical protein
MEADRFIGRRFMDTDMDDVEVKNEDQTFCHPGDLYVRFTFRISLGYCGHPDDAGLPGSPFVSIFLPADRSATSNITSGEKEYGMVQFCGSRPVTTISNLRYRVET